MKTNTPSAASGLPTPPLLAINAFYRKALENGVTFSFEEKVHKITTQSGRVTGIETDRGKIEAPVVVDAAGAYSRPLGKTAGVDIPVIPEPRRRRHRTGTKLF